MFRIVCDPSSGNILVELHLTEIIRSGSQMFVLCLVGVWQSNFEPVVCVYGTSYGLDQAGLGKGQVVGICDCGNEPSSSIKCWEFLIGWKPVSFSRRTLLHGVSKYYLCTVNVPLIITYGNTY